MNKTHVPADREADCQDLRLFLTSVLREEPWNYDSKVIPLPWRYNLEDALKAKLNSSGLTIGYYTCDGNVSLRPKCNTIAFAKSTGSPTSSSPTWNRTRNGRLGKKSAQGSTLDSIQT